jgi:DNA primase
MAWDWLSADDHHLLGHLPAPHGPLFAWLEGQWHEHGPQPWAALREALRAQPFENLALTLHDSGVALERPEDLQAPQADNSDPTEADLRRELAELMRRQHIEDLKAQETAAVAQVATDPAALNRYRDLQRQRLALEQRRP